MEGAFWYLEFFNGPSYLRADCKVWQRRGRENGERERWKHVEITRDI
jgi:hypothetical protein